MREVSRARSKRQGLKKFFQVGATSCWKKPTKQVGVQSNVEYGYDCCFKMENCVIVFVMKVVLFKVSFQTYSDMLESNLVIVEMFGSSSKVLKSKAGHQRYCNQCF